MILRTKSGACEQGAHLVCPRVWQAGSGTFLCSCSCHGTLKVRLSWFADTHARPVGATLAFRQRMQRDTGGRLYRHRQRGIGPPHEVDLRDITSG